MVSFYKQIQKQLISGQMLVENDISFIQQLYDDKGQLTNIRFYLTKILQTLREEYQVLKQEHQKQTQRLQGIIHKKDQEIQFLKAKSFSKKQEVPNTPMKILLKNPSGSNHRQSQKTVTCEGTDNIEDPFSNVDLKKSQNHRFSLQIGTSSNKKIRLSSSKIKDRLIKNQPGPSAPITPRPFFNNDNFQGKQHVPRKSQPRNRVISLKHEKMKTQFSTKLSSPCFFSSCNEQQQQKTPRFWKKEKQNCAQFQLQKKTRLFKKQSKKNILEQIQKKRMNSVQSTSGSNKKNQIIVPVKIINVSDIKLR